MNHSPFGSSAAQRLLARVCLLAVGHVVAAGGEREHVAEIAISHFELVENVHVDRGIARLTRKPVSNAEGQVVLEAELADRLDLGQGGELIGFDEDEGCRFVHFVKRAEYRFRVGKRGKYKAWYRVMFPFRARWNHFERMDGGKPIRVRDSQNDQEAKTWLWLPGPTYELSADEHTFTLDGYHGGARLDKIVFSRPGAPPTDEGPQAAYSSGPRAGRMETPWIRPEGLQRWVRFGVEEIPGGGEAQIRYRTDGKDGWTAIPPDGDLSALDPAQRLKVSFALKCDPNCRTPILQNPMLRYVGPAPVSVANAKVVLEFSATNAGLMRLTEAAGGRAYIRAAASQPLCSLGVVRAGKYTDLTTPTLLGQELVREGDGQTLVQDYSFIEGKLSARTRTHLAGTGQVSMTIHVRNQSDAKVIAVDFPRVGGLRAGRDGSDDQFLLPHLRFNFWRDPAHAHLLWKQTAQYPRAVPMRFVDLWDRQGGLYVASEDKTFRDTGILVDKWDDTSIRLLVRKYVRIVPGGSWTSEPVRLQVHEGDWHWAARKYREWALEHVEHPRPPRWLKEEFDGFAGAYGHAHGAYGFTQTLKVLEYCRRTGGLTDLMGFRQSFDSNALFCGLVPYPNPTWGGAEEFAQTNDLIKQFGGHCIWYINWMLLCPNYLKTPRIGGQARSLLPKDVWLPTPQWFERNVARDAVGEYRQPHPQEVYAHRTLYAASPDVDRWKNYWARMYAANLHTDGVYWDCLLDSYDPNLDPDHPAAELGQWSNGSARSLRRIVEDTRKINPHVMHAGESFGDVNVGQYEDLHMAGARRWLRYLFPEWILVSGRHMPREKCEPERVVANIDHTFLAGARFLNADVPGVAGVYPKGLDRDYGLKVLALQRRTKQLLYRATYRDTDGLRIVLPNGAVPPYLPVALQSELAKYPKGYFPTEPSLAARRFTLVTDGAKVELITTLNTLDAGDSSGGKLFLDQCSLAQVRKLWIFTADGTCREWPFRVVGQSLEVPFPAARHSTLVFAERCEPMLYVRAPSYATWGGSLPVSVDVLNLAPKPIEGMLSLRSPAGFSCRPVRYGPLAPGQKASYALSVSIGPEVPRGRHDLEITADGSAAKSGRLLWTYVGPPLRATISENATRLALDISVENFCTTTVRGKCELLEDDQFRASAPLAFQVEPGEKRTVTMPLTLKRKLVIPHLARIKLGYGDTAHELVKSVRPSIANADFEVDLAGSGNPDYWITRGRYSRFVLDSQVKHSGKYSLRLAPPGRPGRSTYVMNLSQALRRGKKYRFRVAIRREVKSEKVHAFCGVDGANAFVGKLGEAGKWEVFEHVIDASKPPSRLRRYFRDTELFGLGIFGCYLYNGSTGNAWFDALSLDEID